MKRNERIMRLASRKTELQEPPKVGFRPIAGGTRYEIKDGKRLRTFDVIGKKDGKKDN